VSVALPAGHGGLAGSLEFRGITDFVEHVIVVRGGIDAEIATLLVDDSASAAERQFRAV
jgi:hypothetical protein